MINYPKFYDKVFGSVQVDFSGIRELLKSAPEGPIVEFGAGTGRLIPLFDDREGILVENNHDMISILEEKVEGFPNLKIIQANALKTGLPDECASAVIFAFNSIAEMSPIAFTLQEAARLLKTNGKLYIMISHPPHFRTVGLGILRSSNSPLEGTCYSAETIRIPSIGPYYHQVHVEVSNENERQKWIIEHTYPPINFWKRQLSDLGFDVIRLQGRFDGTEFDEKKSEYLIINAQKRNEPAAIKKDSDESAMNEKAYDWLAPKYEAAMSSAEYAVPQWIVTHARDFAKVRPQILDIGCGHGLVGQLLAQAGVKPASLFGIDISKEMVHLAKKSGLYDHVLQSDVSHQLPIYDAHCFDMITAIGVFEFIQDINQVMSQISTSLTIGGVGFFTFELKKERDESKIPFPGGVLTRRARTKEEILSTFEKLPLAVEDCVEVNGYRSPATGEVVPYLLVKVKKQG